jgi:hypothetical protein
VLQSEHFPDRFDMDLGVEAIDAMKQIELIAAG